MRRALLFQRIVVSRDEFLTCPEARTIVAEFIVKTGILSQFQTVDPIAQLRGHGGYQWSSGC